MEWNVCVVSSLLMDEDYGAGLKNALLYGNKVQWVPLASVEDISFLRELLSILQSLPSRQEPNRFATRLEHSLSRHIELVDNFSTISHLVSIEKYEISESATKELEQYKFSEFSPEYLTQIFNEIGSIHEKNPTVANVIFNETLMKPLLIHVNDAFAYALGRHPKVSATISKAEAYILDSELPCVKDDHSKSWNTLNALQKLMRSFQKICLPDVSNFPLDFILELRETVKNEISPMRAELLRMTMELRKRLKENFTIDELAAESDDIIRTLVEPLVLESRKHIEEKLRRKNVNAVTAFGRYLAGYTVAWLTPNSSPLTTISDGMKTITDILSAEEVKPPSATSEFALKLRFAVAQNKN